MANDKKFIVKNGLLTPENAVIGSTTDTGETLQVTGDSVLTQGIQATPTLKVTNSGGHSAATIIAAFEGDSDSLEIRNISAGDYKITNPGVDNSIEFHDGTDGIVINYAGTEIAAFTSTGINFTGVATTTIDDNRILTTADEGSGNNLDADTVDGLEASQFLRSDVADSAAGTISFLQDIDVTGSAQIDTNITVDGTAVIKSLLDAQANAQVAGNLTVGGDFTVSGNTTYVNTEEILLSDNIITLNANYTGSTPTENAGIEVERGTLANPKLVWNETSDYWQLEVDGGVLGRVITTADEGSGNGFDADTVDGLEAAQFLRSDVDDTATGNITIEGDLTIGDGVGAAQINFATDGQDRVLYGNNGTIGFLKSDNSGWNASSDTDGDWNVSRDVEAGRNVIADDDITATSGNISATAGSVSAGTTVTGGTGVIATTGNVSATVGDVTAGNDVTAAQDITATAGDITATAGDVIAGDSITAENDITATSGNIAATAGSVAAGTTVTAGTDVIGQRFVDADDNSYLVNPAADSTMHAIGIDDDLYHNGDTNTKLSFTTDDISLQTGGAERLGIQNASVTASVDVYAPNIVVNDAVIHNNDTNTKVSFATDTINLETGGSTRLTANNSGVTVTGDLDVTGNLTAVDGTFSGDLSAARFLDSDNNAYYADPASTSVMNRIGINDYIQHNDDTNTFFGFDSNDNIIFTTNAVERLEINATNITGTVDAIFPDVYAGRFYDLNNATYYVDPASNSRMSGIGLVGTIFHDGDPDTYLNFNAADSFEIVTGGVQRVAVTTFTTATGSVRSPLFYDTDNTAYYGNFAGTSVMNDISLDDYIAHNGDANTYLGFDANDSITFVTGGVERLNITDANSTFSQPVIVQGDVQADRFVDRNATTYYTHPGDTATSAVFAGKALLGNVSDPARWDDNTGNGGISLMPHGSYATGQGTTVGISGNVSGGYALMYLNLIDSSANPVGNGQRYIHFYHDGVDGGSIRGDSSGNLYQVLKSGTTWGFWNSAYTEALIVDDNANVMVATGSAPTYTDGGDNTPLVGTNNPAKLHVGGSIYLNGNDDAIIFGRGTASFLKDEELAFGWGSGWYMTDATYLKVRNNTNVYSEGSYLGNLFYSYQNTAYYVDPDGDSQLNTVDIDDYVRHRGNTTTWMGFPAADIIRLTTNNVTRVDVTNSAIALNNPTTISAGTTALSLRKTTNGGGIFIEFTDQATPTQFGKIGYYHADGESFGAGSAFLFSSTEATSNYVFAQNGGASGGNLIPQVTNTGTLGNATYRWNTAHIGTGDFSGNVTAANMYASRFYDADNNAYYTDPAGVSSMYGVAVRGDASSTDSGNQIFFWGTGDTTTSAIGFKSNGGEFANPTGNGDGYNTYLTMDTEGRGWVFRRGTGGSNFTSAFTSGWILNNGVWQAQASMRAPIFYDSNNTAYFADPAGESRLATIKLEDGVILRSPNGTFGSLTISGTGRSGYEGFSINDRAVFMHDGSSTTGIYNDVDNHWLIRTVHGQGNYFYYNNTQEASAESGYFLGQNQLRSPIYYDSDNTGYYVDAASNTRLNTIQALRYYFDHATTYYADSASGDYGSMEVGGYKSGWAGYSIAGQWVFMADGVTNAGIYNDTDNKWAVLATRNAEVELYYNGALQAETASGYFLANNQMRAPIYYDSSDTTYFGDFASRSKLNTLELGNQGNLTGSTTYPLGIYHNSRYLIGMRYSGAQAEYPWLVHDNYNFGGKGARSAFIIHFNAVGDRFNLTEDGDLLIGGEMAASNYNISGGNEFISLNPAYGSGGADLVLFDMTKYFEARVIQSLSGSEGVLTPTTSEYVKNSDGPFAGSYVLRTAAYRNFDSDYIPVSPGEDIYGEVSVRLISGSGGLVYFGVRRYDKDKLPIAGNDGITYFVAGGVNVTDTNWVTYRNHTTIPATHTPYNGSDGGACRFVRLILLFNYNTGGALREYGGIMLKRRNAESNLLVDDLRVADQLNVDGNAFITGDLTVDDITADVIDANIFRDRSDTAYYVDPASTGTSVNVRGVIQNPSIWINDGNEVNSYNENIRLFNASNGISVIAFSATGNAGAPATSILGFSDRLETRRVNDWQQRTYAGIAEFVGDIRPTLMYDRNDTAYYLDPNSNGRMLQLGIGYRAGGKRLDVTGDHGNTAIRLALNAPQNGNGTGEWALQAWVSEPGRTWEGAGFGYNVDNNLNANTNQYYLGRPNTIGGQAYMRFERDGHTIFYNTDTAGTRYTSMSMFSGNYITVGNYLQAANSLRAPIFYDSDNTAYYTDQASTSRHNIQQANFFSHTADVSDTSTFGLYFDSGRSTAYAIYKEGGAWTYPYPDLRIAFHTGIKFGANASYNGMRFYTDYDMSSQVMSINNSTDPLGAANVYVNYNLQAGDSLRAPIFYDSNDTTYYVDPNSASNAAIRQRGGTYHGPNTSWGEYLYVGTNGWVGTGTASVAVTNGNLHLDAKSGYSIILNNYVGGQTYNIGNFYSDTYYDRNDPTYYGDFASTSYMNDVRANIFYERENTAYYFGSSQGDARFRDVRTNNIRVEDGVTIESVNGNGRIYLSGNLHIDANGGNDLFLNYYSGRRTRMYAPGQVEAARLDTDRIFYSFYDTRSPIYYDYNDTGYYADPNATSVFRRLTLTESLNGYLPDNFGRFRWSTGYFNNGTSTANFVADLGDNEALSQGFTAQKVPWDYAGNSDVNTGIQNIEMAGTSIATWHDGSYFTSLVIRPTTGASGGSVYIYNDQGAGYSPGWRQVATSSTDFFNYNSIRSPIFYDTNNTGYYMDMNGTSYWNTSQQDAYHTFLNYGLGVTGTYTSTRLQLVFAMGAAYRPSADGTATANMYGIGWSHPNAGSLGGANQLNDHGLLIINNGTFRAAISSRAVFSADVRTPIYYDWNDTGYYLDPNASSNLAQDLRTNEFYARGWFRNDSAGTGLYNQSTSMHWYSLGSGSWRAYSTANTVEIQMTTSGNNMRGYVYANNSNEIGFLNQAGSWNFRTDSGGNNFSTTSSRAPIFYDNNDTTYYGDFNSTSDAAVRQRGGTLHGPNITWGRYLAVGGNGRYNNEASVATTDGNLHLDSRSGNSLYLQWYVGGTTYVNGAVQADIYYDRNDTNYYGDFASTSYMNDVRANIFYDRNNTAFYFGSGDGDSRFNTTTVNGLYNYEWFRNYNAGQGLYNQATGRHFYSPGSTYWHLDGAAGNGGLIIYDSYQASQETGTGRRGYLYYDSSGFGLLNSSGNWGFRMEPGNGNAEVYRTLYASSIQAYILYDRDNTAYYFDGASVNSTRFEGVSNRTKAMMGLPGRTGNSAEYYSARPRITGDSNYWTGSMGWGTIDMNSVAHWGSGFIDSWGNPANQPSGTSHWVGTQAYHYTDNSAYYLGWQMVGGPIGNLRFRNAWSSWSAWRTVPMLDVNDGNGGAMYAGIYYDSNNTGYYVDPNSYSNMNEGNFAGRMWFSNYVVSRGDGGMMGSYNATGTAEKVIWTIGESWPIGNMYGLAYSYGSGYGHHLALKNNGSTYHRISFASEGAYFTGTVTASSDFRAPIFYDTNNTGYYTDPNGTSNLNVLNVQGGANNFYGITYFHTNNGGYSGATDSAKLQAYSSSNNSAMMSFHRGGYYATNMGLDADNVMRIGGWSAAANRWELDMSGNNWVASSFRAPIFYDSNDTGYYIDPNGTSNFNIWTSETSTRIGRPTYWTNRYAIYGTINGYQTGTNGWGTGEGTWANAWKGGFSGWDIWGGGTDHPQGAGYIHAQGIVSGQHYATSDGGSAYGWMMVGATNATENRYWARGKWGGGISGWKEFAMYGGGGSGDLRANIFYDSDNTGYYVDPNSSGTSVRIAGDILCDANYGKGLVGVYSASRYQHVFAMGSAYRLPADGTSTGNLYGMAWSHPNAGGAAGNLDSHGLLILINGGFASAMSYSIRASGNITAYSDERLKTNWRPMPEDFVSRLSEVRVGIYDRTDGEQLTQVGVSAQSLQELLPEAITAAKDEMGTLSVNYGGAALASAVELAKAIKEQRLIINNQQDEINTLKRMVSELMNKIS